MAAPLPRERNNLILPLARSAASRTAGVRGFNVYVRAYDSDGPYELQVRSRGWDVTFLFRDREMIRIEFVIRVSVILSRIHLTN